MWYCEFHHTHPAGKSLDVLLPKQGPDNLYGQITLMEVQRYLKTGPGFQSGKEVIQRNILYILKSLLNGETFQDILNGYPQSDRENSV